MKLDGKHITLRSTEIKDVDLILGWENDPEHWLVSNTVAPYSREQIQAFVEGGQDIYEDQQLRLMILSKAGQVVGCIDLYDFDPKNQRVGIGILIDKASRGKGFGKDALETLVAYCFEKLDMHMLYAEVPESNDASRHLFEVVGFHQNGVRRDWLWDGQRFLDQYIFQRMQKE